MSVRRTLRRLVESKNGLVVPGAYDGVSARLVERAGFPAVYMTGYGTSASRLGLPDLGYAGLAEMADHARNLAAAVSIPLVADAVPLLSPKERDIYSYDDIEGYFARAGGLFPFWPTEPIEGYMTYDDILEGWERFLKA